MTDTLTKAALAEKVHAKVGISKREAAGLVDEVFEIVLDTLGQGEAVKVSGFGNFVVEDKAARRGRNPQSGEDIVIARHRVVKFRYSPKLRDALNED